MISTRRKAYFLSASFVSALMAGVMFSTCTQLADAAGTSTRVNQARTFPRSITITNSPSGTVGTGTQINTGDPSTKGLIIKGAPAVAVQAAPTSLSGLQAYYKSDAEVYSDTGCTSLQTTNAGNVRCWKDQSGNGYHLTNSSAALYRTNAVNSLPAIQINGANSELLNNSFPALGTSDLTIVAVMRAGSFVDGQVPFNVGSGGTTNTMLFNYMNGTTGDFYWGRYGNQFLNQTPGYANTSAYHIIAGHDSGTTFSSYVNLNTALTNTQSVNITAAGLRLGGLNASSLTWDGYFAMFAIWNRALTTTEMTQLHNWISTTYNITLSGQLNQTANLLEVQDHSSTAKIYVDSDYVVNTTGARTDVKNYRNWQDDFLGFNSRGSELGFAATVTGTGATSSERTDSGADNPGQWTLDTGTTATGTAAISLAANSVLLGSGKWNYEWLVNIPSLSTVSEEYEIRAGMLDNATAAPTDGVFLRYRRLTSTNWICEAYSSTSATTSSSGAVAVATGWNLLRVEVNAAGTSASCYVNGTLAGTVTTNIPKASGRNTGPMLQLVKTAGTTSTKIHADRFFMEHWWGVARQ